MGLFLFGLILMAAFGDSSKSKRDKKRMREARERKERKRRYHDSLGYYEHLYGQGHP